MCLSLHIQMSSSKKAGIDGECAWPQHRRGAADGCQHDRNPGSLTWGAAIHNWTTAINVPTKGVQSHRWLLPNRRPALDPVGP